MTFFGPLTLVTALLHYKRRISYLALRQELGLDETGLEALKIELTQVEHVAVDENGEFLVWAGSTEASASASDNLALEERFTGGIHNRKILVEKASSEVSAGTNPLPVVPPSGDAERRRLTVMFCDLVGSTALSTELDPEDLREVIQVYQQACTGILRRYNGYVAKYMGDGILVYFGYPRAQEGDAKRSVHSALAIVQAVRELNDRSSLKLSVELAVRVGIATGLVVVGDLIGDGASQERNVVGETPNLAARLQGLAASNQVVIAADTHVLTGDTFDCEDLGLQELKGIAKPVRAWAVVAERDADYKEKILAEPEILVGRQEELGLLRRAWEQSREGAGQVVLLCGEAGLGKSCMAEALSVQVKKQGGLRVTLRCSRYHTNSALYPVITHLQSAFGLQREDDNDTRLAKLERAMDSYRFPDAETIPVLANLLSLPLPEGRFKPLSAPPEIQRQRTLDTIVTWILEQVERQPVLQVWEDLEWADPSTLELLGLFIERCEPASLMNLLTYRPDFSPPWGKRSIMFPVTLSRLERTEIEAIIREEAGKALPEKLLLEIVAKADGVPLYAKELTKSVLASDLVREVNGRYELTQLATSVTIPATLQESLMARLDGLGAAKNLAQLGAAIGDQFSHELLQVVATEDAGTIRQALNSLVEADLLARRGRAPHLTYRFRQGLIRDVAYESLLRQRREAMHGAIAQAIEALEDTETEEHIAILAYHYGRSSYLDRAVTYALRAGDHASRLHARTEATSYYNQALETARELGEAPQVQRIQIDAMLKLATVSASREDLERDQHNLKQAQRMAETLGDQPRLAQIYYRLGRVHYARGVSDAAADYSEKSLAIADTLGDEVLAAPAINLLGRHYTLQGNVARGSEMLARNVEQMHVTGDTAEEATAAGFAGMAFGWKGDFAQGFAYADRGLALAKRTEDPFAVAAAYNYRGAVHLQRGAWVMAIADLEKGRQIAEASDDGFRCYVLKAYEGEAQIESANPKKARELLDEAITFAENIGTKFQLAVAKRSCAAAALRFGKIDDAIAACHEAIQIAEEATELLVKSRAYQLLVETWCRLDKIDRCEAEQTILEAIRIQREFGAEPELARSNLVYARLLFSQGDTHKAKEYFGQATDIFRRSDMDWDLARAEKMLLEGGLVV